MCWNNSQPISFNSRMSQMLKPALLNVDALHFRYPDCLLFGGLSFEIHPGVTLVRGGDGCGKSTLLRLLAGTLEPQSGTLCINNVSAHEQPRVYRAQVFWADPQSTAFEQTTVRDYLAVQSSQHAGFDQQILASAIEGLGLEPHIHKALFMLSTGTKRKVWLAAAFACGAAITLLDEPFAALDGPSIAFVMQQLTKAARQTQRAYVLADYVAPAGIALASVIDVGEQAT